CRSRWCGTSPPSPLVEVPRRARNPSAYPAAVPQSGSRRWRARRARRNIAWEAGEGGRGRYGQVPLVVGAGGRPLGTGIRENGRRMERISPLKRPAFSVPRFARSDTLTRRSYPPHETPMPTDLYARLAEWRKSLLDTTKRNRLIKFVAGRVGG